jgi:hypothetical protein
MAKGAVTVSMTKSNQDHREKGQSSRWTIIKVFTHISLTASSKRSSRSAHRASCTTQQRSYVRRRKEDLIELVRERTAIARQGRAPKIEIVDLNRTQHDFPLRLLIDHLQFERISSFDLLRGLAPPRVHAALLPELRKRILDRIQPRVRHVNYTPSPWAGLPSSAGFSLLLSNILLCPLDLARLHASSCSATVSSYKSDSILCIHFFVSCAQSLARFHAIVVELAESSPWAGHALSVAHAADRRGSEWRPCDDSAFACWEARTKTRHVRPSMFN